MQIMISIFTKIIRRQTPSYIIYDSGRVIAILDRCPINTGHVLVIPYEEVSDINDLEIDRYHELWDVVRNLRNILKEAFDAPKVGIAVEGFGVDHAHVHLVPVYSGNQLNPERAVLASDADLQRAQEAIRSVLEG